METNAKPTAQKLYDILTAAGYIDRYQIATLDLAALRKIAADAGIAKRITARHRTQVLAYFPNPDDGADPFADLY